MYKQNFINARSICTWQIIVSEADDEDFYVDFVLPSEFGPPFAFTASMKRGSLSSLVEDIALFVEDFDAESYMQEWNADSRPSASGEQQYTIINMEDLKVRAWLLALRLASAPPEMFFFFEN